MVTFGQRVYDPARGLFLSPDQGGSDQAYGYASGNPLTFSDLTGMSDTDQILASVSRITGYVSMGALGVAVGCTVAVVCAPAVPFALAVAAVTGTVAGVSDGILSARACSAKGNCSRLLADLALIAVTSRLPAVRSVSRVGRTAGRACSFTGDTEVLMADGSTKPISEVQAGDQVYAADPETGESGARAVTRTWLHRDTVVDLELAAGVVSSTEDHPFWNQTDREFQRADTLDAGDRLRTADGRTMVVRGLVAGTTRPAAAYNLTVEDIHTYYVLAGATPVLVHNSGGGCKEVVLASFGSFEQARNKALNLLGKIDPATRQPYVGRLDSAPTTYGKVVGFTTRVDGEFKRFRMDYDPVKGPHINVEIGKGDSARKWAVPWSGTEDDFARMLGGNS